MNEETLRNDMKAALRAKDGLRTQVIRALLAAAKNRAIELRVETIPESEMIAVIKREAKQRSEALEFARKAGRDDLVSEHVAASSIIEQYLPKQMSEAELRVAIEQIVSDLGMSEMGPVMKELGKRHGGSYDGKLASGIVNEIVRGTGR
jgi:uncharacterized protein YqeY